VVDIRRTAAVPSLLLLVSSLCGTPYSLLLQAMTNSPSLFSVCRQ
jgi:hypothetical protein